CERPDLDALTQEDRRGESSGLVDVDIAGGPHAGEELLTEVRTFDLPTEEVGVRARVFGDGPDVGPVAVGDVAKEGLAFAEEAREEVLAEIEDLADRETLEDARLDDVDTRVDRVAEDLAPRWFPQQLGGPPVLAGGQD